MAFQGSLRELPLPDVIQLVAVSGKTGVFALRSGNDSGRIFLRKGQIEFCGEPAELGQDSILASYLGETA